MSRPQNASRPTSRRHCSTTGNLIACVPRGDGEDVSHPPAHPDLRPRPSSDHPCTHTEHWSPCFSLRAHMEGEPSPEGRGRSAVSHQQ